ncbi:hypothetical protein LTR78_010217 [Recurvomyces mirabilis]|uniref:WW domain-containing protein n=1 Tax=Recurvomyces mirabilis TaxID=574656 RepID=A0AAE0WF55_9PEZI|nr:hypothetical protein LTR78_010217 [Recurvomyces mirabilis]KAK5149683.1 hypothetical protein LTS14_010744 [Recurvomyces mirabilis]
MSFFGGRRDEEERFTETEQYSTNYDRGYGNQYGGPRNDERFTETETTTYHSNNNNSNIPPPPQVPYPWRPHWQEREGRYIFVNEQNGERTWEFPGRRGGYETETTTTTYSQQGGGGYGRGYGGEERVYEQDTYTQRESERRGGGGHGMMYGAMGAAAGLAGGAFLMHEGGKIEDRFEEDKYRVEDDVEDFPENAARWTGNKVQEVEDIPEDIEGGFDRFGNRVERKWDNAVDDVEDAPEDVSNWAGRKVGDVERFGDNMDNAYDGGRDECRYDDDDRY